MSEEKSMRWAIAMDVNMGVGYSGVGICRTIFRLHNVMDGSTYKLKFDAMGTDLTLVPVSASVNLTEKFNHFKTKKPMVSNDFNWSSATLASIGASGGTGPSAGPGGPIRPGTTSASAVNLVFWEGFPRISRRLATVRFRNAALGARGTVETPNAGATSHTGILRVEGPAITAPIPIPLDPPPTKPVRPSPGYINIPIAPSPPPAPVRPPKRRGKVVLECDVLFGFDSSRVKAGATKALSELADYLDQQPSPRVTIEGHADSKGSSWYNKQLSLRRAEAVRNWLMERGVEMSEFIKVVGKGESDPIEPNTINGRDNPSGRAKNRRVEVDVR